jgi:predicted Zn finger-like uncharacterized protein
MALATKCPHCSTIFRVAHDQLKLRGGIVRCGACNEVFDGNAALIQPQAAPHAPHTPPSPLPPPMALDAKLDALDHRAAALHEQHEDEIQTLHLDAAPAEQAAAAEYTPPWEEADLPAAPTAAADADAALDESISHQQPGTEPAAPLSAADFPPPAALQELDLDFDLDLPAAEGEAAPQATAAEAAAPSPASTLAASEPAIIVPAADEEEPIELDISGMSDDELEAALQAELDAIDAAEAELQRETAAVEADLAEARARAAEAPAPAHAPAPAEDLGTAEPTAEPTIEPEHAPAIEPAAGDAWPDASDDAQQAEPTLTAADMLPPSRDERREPTFGALDDDDFDADEEALVQLSAAGVARSGHDLGPAAGTHALHSLDAAPHSLTAAHSLDDDIALADADADEQARAHAHAAADDAALEEPGFVKRDRRRQRLGRIATVVMSAGSVLLVAGLAGQVVATFRNPLAAAVPALKPALNAVCAPLGCKVELPAQIESVTIEQGELQSLSENTFSFTTLLRNQSATAQTWPHIELVLDDDKDKAILRRVFTPADYLAPGAAQRETLAQGFGPHSEQSVKLYFELKQLKASGYHIAVFYP